MLLAAAALAVLPASGEAAAPACTGDPTRTLSTQPAFGLAGLYALPARPPAVLAVFAHGYRNASPSWAPHLVAAARDHGAVAVAVDYRGLGPAPDYRGWPAAAGARDLVTAGRYFAARCPSIKQVALLGVSMGGNMSGLALASRATRPGSSRPLFDFWVDVEGVTNLTETWSEASASAGGNPYAAGARDDIEKETGGPFPQQPAAFQSRTVVMRADDVAAAHPRGVVMIHSAEDGLVPYDQTREMAAALRSRHVPTDVYTVLRRTSARDPGHDQTTLIGDVAPSLADSDPFSGHAWEGSTTHIVMRTAMARLWALVGSRAAQPRDREYLVDAQAGTVPAA